MCRLGSSRGAVLEQFAPGSPHGTSQCLHKRDRPGRRKYFHTQSSELKSKMRKISFFTELKSTHAQQDNQQYGVIHGPRPRGAGGWGVAAVSRGFTVTRAINTVNLRVRCSTWACEGRGSRRLSLRFVNAVRHENRASARAAASASDVHESHEPAGPPSCEPSEAIEAAEAEGGIEAAADGGAEAAAVAAVAAAATAEAEAAEAEAAEAEAAEAAWQPHAACASCAEVS